MKAWITYDLDEDGDSIAHIRMADSYGAATTVATLPSGPDLTKRANLIVGAIQNDTGRVAKERDSLRSEVARLTAEVEAMRGVVEAARPIAAGDGHPSVMRSRLAVQLTALDALRARKVGG